MRKINNGQKFHSNNNNTIYSLNYKFDSVCSAGKFSGTALDLIKKYNELAKEAHSNGDYVEMEVFRQYAEHYRKIVTEINERKNQNRENRQANAAENIEQPQESGSEAQQPVNNGLVETEAADVNAPSTAEADNNQTSKPISKTTRRHRGFTVVEVSAAQEQLPKENTEQAKSEEATSKPKRGRRPLMKRNASPATDAAEAQNA